MKKEDTLLLEEYWLFITTTTIIYTGSLVSFARSALENV